ncbi:MAG: putative proteasome-type protease [Candidatus Paceibacteria bacterium]|jgi:putative proteasome-type protease
MTYCVAMRLDAGLVFLSDSRTNAGVDHVGTFRKMSVFEIPGDRMMVMMTAGNLAISQSVRQLLTDHKNKAGRTLWTATSMFEAAQILGDAIRTVHERDSQALDKFGISFNASMIFGGQIKGERCRLFQIYSAGNFIESLDESVYLQIGEAKYGKPIIDRVVSLDTSLDEAAKCALISMDSTLRSNISVGLPLDLLVYEADRLAVTRFVAIDEKNQYFRMIRDTWGQQLKSVFDGIDNPVWDAAPEVIGNVLSHTTMRGKPVRVPVPQELSGPAEPVALQVVAQNGTDEAQQ